MAGDTRMTSTNSVLFPLYKGELTFKQTFSLPTFVNMLLGRFHEVFLPFEGTDADDQRRLRKSQQSQKTRKSFEQSRSKLFRLQLDSQNEAAACYLV